MGQTVHQSLNSYVEALTFSRSENDYILSRTIKGKELPYQTSTGKHQVPGHGNEKHTVCMEKRKEFEVVCSDPNLLIAVNHLQNV
jgi:hypothetical protein